jgi:hypothetical protein
VRQLPYIERRLSRLGSIPDGPPSKKVVREVRWLADELSDVLTPHEKKIINQSLSEVRTDRNWTAHLDWLARMKETYRAAALRQ